MTREPDRLTAQFERAQLAEIAELERAVEVFSGLVANYERKLAEAQRRVSD
ncbi:hypothetical protein [Paenibacillus odorifer]|uniref:hypothetical protein n=1 Tax=Paenibacillus TaxID=44249 RepID=UPI0015C3E426|nr:hypothetical protein [Paenibacillus odorifer]